MIALPALVAAMAKLEGFDVPKFDLDDLLVRDVIVTEELSRKLIGGALDGNGKFVAPQYEESRLWKQRAELWKALGEDDPSRYTVDALKKNGSPADSNVQSKKLKRIMELHAYPWQQPLWARLEMVADPRIGAVTSGGKNLSVPAIVEVFAGREEAEKVAKAEAERFGKSDGESVATVNMPAIPKGWDEDSWLKVVTEVLEPFRFIPKMKAKAEYNPDDYDVEFDVMWTWVEWLKAGN